MASIDWARRTWKSGNFVPTSWLLAKRSGCVDDAKLDFPYHELVLAGVMDKQAALA